MNSRTSKIKALSVACVSIHRITHDRMRILISAVNRSRRIFRARNIRLNGRTLNFQYVSDRINGSSRAIRAGRLNGSKTRYYTMRLLIRLLFIAAQFDNRDNTTPAPSKTASNTDTDAANTLLAPQLLTAAESFKTDLLHLTTLATTDRMNRSYLIRRNLIRFTAGNALKSFSDLDTIRVRLRLDFPLGHRP